MLKKIENTVTSIESLIKQHLPESKYQFELFDLITNTRHFRGHDELFHWGSIYKLFVVAEIIKMADEGLLRLDNEIELHKELYVHGNGVTKFLTHLNSLTYIDACKMVIAVSDNLCADELLGVVGFKRLNNLFANSGALSSKLEWNLDSLVKAIFQNLPKEIGVNFYHSETYFKHFEYELNVILRNNYTTVKDINTCFHYIFSGHLSVVGKSYFKDCLLLSNVHSRLSYYTLFSNLLLKGKTGALGVGIFNSETAAIFDKTSKEIYGYFSVATNNNRKRYFQSNDVIALIGIEIIRLYEQLLFNNE